MLNKTIWHSCRLGELAEFRNGVNFTKANFGSGIKVINVKDFQDYSVPKFNDLSEINPRGIVSEADLLEEGDIVFVRSNGNRELIGRSLFISAHAEPITYSAFTIRVRFKSDDVIPRFYAYLFRTTLIRRVLSAHGGGTNISNLNQQILSNLKVPVPPLKTQEAILATLLPFDDLIDNNLRRIDLLEQAARKLYRDWFVHFRFPEHEQVRMIDSNFGKVPDNWQITTLKEVCSHINRGIAPTYDEMADTIVINQRCIRDGRLNLILARRNSRDIPEEKLVRFGDILVNSTGEGTLGRVAQVCEEIANCTVDSHVSIVRPSNPQYNDYLASVMLEAQPHLATLGEGATNQTELTRTRLGSYRIFLPPIDLARAFSEFTMPTRKQIIVLLKKNQNLSTIQDLLLTRLMSGELDVSNLNNRMSEELATAENGA